MKLFDGAGSHLLALSVPNNLLITFSKHTGLCLWSLTSRRCLKRSWIKGVNPLSLVASPDGEMLAIGTANTIEIFQLPELTHLFSFLEHGNSITTLDFSPDSKLLASGGADSAIRIWSLHDRDKIHELNGHLSPLEAIKFSPSGDLLVSASNDATFRFWDTNSGDLLKTVLDLSPTSYVILSPDGSFHATPDAEDYLSFTVVGDEECRNLTVDEFEDKYEKGWRKSKEILKR